MNGQTWSEEGASPWSAELDGPGELFGGLDEIGFEELEAAGPAGEELAPELGEELDLAGELEGDLETLEGTLLGEIASEVSVRSDPAYIRWVQAALNQIQGSRLQVDGLFGSGTRAVIRQFQAARGLRPDGIVGPQTEAALIQAGAGPPPGSGAGAPGRPPVITLPPSVITARPRAAVLDRFAFDRSDLERHHVTILRKLAARIAQSWLGGQPIRTVRVVGHTDPTGSAAYNVGLGQRRALAVRGALRRGLEDVSHGLAGRVSIVASSRGEHEQVADNNTQQGRAMNRRVEVFVSTPAAQPAPAGCDQRELERRLNECRARATAAMIRAKAKFDERSSCGPRCFMSAKGLYEIELRHIRERLRQCQERAIRDTGCELKTA